MNLLLLGQNQVVFDLISPALNSSTRMNFERALLNGANINYEQTHFYSKMTRYYWKFMTQHRQLLVTINNTKIQNICYSRFIKGIYNKSSQSHDNESGGPVFGAKCQQWAVLTELAESYR